MKTVVNFSDGGGVATRDTIQLSNDQKKIAFERYIKPTTETGRLDYSVEIHDTETNKNTVIIADNANSDDRGPLQPIGWSADDTKVILTEYTCYQCDGPVRSKVWQYDLESKKLEMVFELKLPKTANEGESLSDGEISIDPTGKYVSVLNANDRGCCGRSLAEAEKTRYQLSIYDLGSKEQFSAIQLTGESTETVQAYGYNADNSGWSGDGRLLALNTMHYEAVEDQESVSGQFKKIQVFDSKTKQIEDISLKIAGLTDSGNSYITQLIPHDNGVIIYAQTTIDNVSDIGVKAYNFNKADKKVASLDVGYTLGENDVSYDPIVGFITVAD